MRAVIAFVVAMAAGSASAADVTVRVHGVANDHGAVVVGICTEDVFVGGTCAFRGTSPARGGTVPVVITGVAPGAYAVRAYHDENANNRIDRNFLGIPLEGFGFGNDAKVVLSPPSFADAAITVDEGGAEIALSLRYWLSR
ncbi:MAG TPA: DUF2141 domain-containing protein [Azospirillum sp.]|nr:DUF2141 domain-containing protein [Azospirillum sp.]